MLFLSSKSIVSCVTLRLFSAHASHKERSNRTGDVIT